MKKPPRRACGSSRIERMSIWRQRIQSLARKTICLLYTSDAADERSSVDLGGRRIIKKNNKKNKHSNIKKKKEIRSQIEIDIQAHRSDLIKYR